MVEQNPAPSTTSLERQFRTADSVVVARQADATILLDLRKGHYYTLNEVSGLIWSLLATGASMSAVMTRVREEFDAPEDQLKRDVEEFVASLLSAKLIRRED